MLDILPDEIVVTVREHHWNNAAHALRNVNHDPHIVALCCPLFQAIRERVGPGWPVLVGYDAARIGTRDYSLDDNGIAITASFTARHYNARPLPMPTEVRLRAKAA